ncbi:MAG: flagellar hook-associated protein FlgK [Vicinamibacterales bacterium]
MAGLLGNLTLASQALQAQQRGLEVTGQNIANVNTPGYARRVADLVSIAPTEPTSAGNGVTVAGVRAMRDQQLDRRLFQEIPGQTREAAVAEQLSVIENVFGAAGQSVDGRLSALHDAFSLLAENPQSATARDQVRRQAGALASEFQAVDRRMQSVRMDADVAVRTAVTELNRLAEQVASANRSLSGASAATTANLQDTQTELVRKVSELANVGISLRGDGGIDLSFADGRPLVIGGTAYAVSAVSTPPDGMASLVTAGTAVDGEISGGRVGGLLRVRDVLIPGYQEQLDTLAQTVADEFNAIHEAGFDQTGAAGGPLFTLGTTPPDVTGAARTFTLSAAIDADPRLIVAGATTDAGDNEQAKAMAVLRDARVMSGGTATLTEAWGQLVFAVGRDSAAASQEAGTQEAIVNQLDVLRDQVSGISLDEEAMQMLKFQRAYEASARYFSAVSQTLDILLQTVGR